VNFKRELMHLARSLLEVVCQFFFRSLVSGSFLTFAIKGEMTRMIKFNWQISHCVFPLRHRLSCRVMSWIKRNRARSTQKEADSSGNLRISLPMTIPGELANLRRFGSRKKRRGKEIASR
jgi:hypothetical protein